MREHIMELTKVVATLVEQSMLDQNLNEALANSDLSKPQTAPQLDRTP